MIVPVDDAFAGIVADSVVVSEAGIPVRVDWKFYGFGSRGTVESEYVF